MSETRAMNLIIGNGEVVTPLESFHGGVIIEGRHIAGVFRGKPLDLPATYLDAAGNWILPGFIDLHLHGGCGVDFNTAAAAEVQQAVRFHAACGGVTALLPTVMTASPESMFKAVKEIRRARQELAAPEILGVHLEGPFLNPGYKGAHPAEHLSLPQQELMDEIWQASAGDLALITLAPELPGGLEAVSYFSRRGTVVALGHSGASFEQVEEALAVGLSHAVHTFSGMAGFHHRRPGTVGAVLSLDGLSAEAVADGIHTHPAALKLLCRVKPAQKLVLVTDASPGAGLAAGEVTLGGQTASVSSGCSRLADGTLAGSTLTMNRAVAGAVSMGGLSFQEAVAAATINPARVLGLETRKGSLARGKDADVIVMNSSYEVLLTVSRGWVLHNCLSND